MRDIDSLPGDPPFKDAVWQILELHSRKMADYGAAGDPYANVRASEDFGIPAWVGVSIRLNDKMRRLMTAAQRGKETLQNESLRDSFLDLAVYSLIGIVLLDELEEKENERSLRERSPGLRPVPTGEWHNPPHGTPGHRDCIYRSGPGSPA